MQGRITHITTALGSYFACLAYDKLTGVPLWLAAAAAGLDLCAAVYALCQQCCIVTALPEWHSSLFHTHVPCACPWRKAPDWPSTALLFVSCNELAAACCLLCWSQCYFPSSLVECCNTGVLCMWPVPFGTADALGNAAVVLAPGLLYLRQALRIPQILSAAERSSCVRH